MQEKEIDAEETKESLGGSSNDAGEMDENGKSISGTADMQSN